MPWNLFRAKPGAGGNHASSNDPSESGARSIGSARSDSSVNTRRHHRSDTAYAPGRSRGAGALILADSAKPVGHGPQSSKAGAPSGRSMSGRAAGGKPGMSNSSRAHRRTQSMLDPESDPLSGLTGFTISVSSQQSVHRDSVHRDSIHSESRHPAPFGAKPGPRRISSAHSTRSTRSGRSSHSALSALSSSRSLAGSPIGGSRNLKASRMAKHAMAALIASKEGQPLHCYTCDNQFMGLRCDRCRTAYLPPGFVFSAAEALGDGGATTVVTSIREASSALPESSAPTTSAASVFGSVSYVGVVPDVENDFDANNAIDLELISDLAACNDYGLLEAVVFDFFSNIDTVTNVCYMPTSAAKASSDDPEGADEQCYTDAPADIEDSRDSTNDNGLNPRTDDRAGDSATPKPNGDLPNFQPSVVDLPSFVDGAAVSNLYSILGSVSSTGPIRGILQGAEAVLLTRKHNPVTEKELAYICVILQCPAITECSMFTKITGPMQKLARYASLRSRARLLLEICSGLIAHSDERYHSTLVDQFASWELGQFQSLVELANAYVSHRLLFHFQYKAGQNSHPSRFQRVRHDWYADDWRIIVVVKFLSFLWAANEARRDRKTGMETFSFYNTMVDQINLQDDFDSWQASRHKKNPRFSFCRYPFLLSAGSKAKIFEHGIRREVNSSYQREIFAIMADPARSRSLQSQQIQLSALRTIVLKVRRTHLFADTMVQLKKWQVSKRRELRVEFDGEQGIDAGGLKREWCLMFYRQLLDPKLGAFVVDETSNYCWFGEHPDLDIYRCAGMVLGLALFNSITIDFNLPLLLFKLLIDKPYNLDDVATLWPAIAQSLQSILDYDSMNDFEETFGLSFVAPDGTQLIPDGESKPVTYETRELYVELLVEHLVTRNGSSAQFRIFKSAFLEVCGSNALLLFQPTELELLVRGDRKPIDVPALRSVTKYVNFGHRYDRANREPVVQWFWDYFQKLDAEAQAKLMRFVTATDRVPAAGTINLPFSIMCLGEDSQRLPIAHTCFNQLCIYKYKTRKKLEKKLSVAVAECQGFGLK